MYTGSVFDASKYVIHRHFRCVVVCVCVFFFSYSLQFRLLFKCNNENDKRNSQSPSLCAFVVIIMQETKHWLRILRRINTTHKHKQQNHPTNIYTKRESTITQLRWQDGRIPSIDYARAVFTIRLTFVSPNKKIENENFTTHFAARNTKRNSNPLPM